KSQLPKSFTIAPNTTVNYAYESPLAGGTGKQYRWSSTSGTGSASTAAAQSGSVTVSATSTVTASYTTQYKLTLATAPIAGIGGVGNPSASPASADGFYNENTTVSVSATVDVDIVAGASRWHFKEWTGGAAGNSNPVGVTLDGPKTVTATYDTQYKLTLATNPGPVGLGNLTTDPSSVTGFYNPTTVVTVSAAAIVAIDAGSRYKFKDFTGASNPDGKVTLDAPKTVTAN